MYLKIPLFATRPGMKKHISSILQNIGSLQSFHNVFMDIKEGGDYIKW